MILVPHIFVYLFAALALCGAGYTLLSLFAIASWKKVKHPAPGTFTPGISILKSLRGTDRAMYEAFRSHCLQDYAEFELLFGVSDLNDPAVAEVEKLKKEFPSRRIELIHCPKQLGANGKVSTLAQLLPHAKLPIILINDSDITVEHDYLKKVAAEFSDEKVGLVTALYRAEAGDSLASRIEALTIATDFAPGVLTARVVEGGIHFALGSTIAIRRTVLREIGGLEPLADYLADDYELGARTSAAGYRVALADTVVETHLPSYGFGGMLAHQMRWARTIRDRRLGGYVGLVFTYMLPWAVLTMVLSDWALWAVLMMVVVTELRMLQVSRLVRQVLGSGAAWKDLWLVPLRDFVALYVWVASFFGNTVEWRGQKFLVKRGRLSPVQR